MEKNKCSYIAVGAGWVDGKRRVAMSDETGWVCYLSPDLARYVAMQILMTANEIDQQKIEEEVE